MAMTANRGVPALPTAHALRHYLARVERGDARAERSSAGKGGFRRARSGEGTYARAGMSIWNPATFQ